VSTAVRQSVNWQPPQCRPVRHDPPRKGDIDRQSGAQISLLQIGLRQEHLWFLVSAAEVCSRSESSVEEAAAIAAGDLFVVPIVGGPVIYIDLSARSPRKP
jgi:hypothetical protein